MGNNRDGAAGDDLEVKVPDGTVVLDENGRLLADLVGAGTRFEAAAGGRGGLGNAALASRARKAPGFALLGEKGQARDLTLELKTVADVGLIGFPSAGKSSLVSVISAAKPKIADYPFTTLVPNLGVVSAGEHSFTVADVPGLIPGASQGRGLGLDFLRHIERCAVLVHVVDCATAEPGRDPISDIDALEAELAAYTPTLQGDATLGDLAERPRAVVLNKIDVPEARELAEFVRDEIAAERGWPVFEVSTVTREGLQPLIFALWQMVSDYQAAQPQAVPRRPVIRPVPVDDSGFTVEPDADGGFVVRGPRPERWVRQTDFDNDEAVGYLGDRLARLGVEDELLRLGAQPGCAVTIGDMTFDWEPQTPTGVDHAVRPGHRRAAGAQRPGRRRRAQGRAASAPRTRSRPRSNVMSSPNREAIRTARSVVVKVGTTALTTPAGMFDAGRLAELVDAIEARMKAGSDVVIVSSGAIAAGIEPLGLSRRPTDLATKQAAASVGQVALVNSWSAAFARYGRTVGQVLLTAHDISMRVQHTNAQRTLDRLRALHAVAIVNENDTVATNEIRFGDNDRLSALVAHLVGADALVLLSDIDGLYDSDPRKADGAKFIAEVTRAGRPRRCGRRSGQPPGHRRDGVEGVVGAAGRRRRGAGAAGRRDRRRGRADRRLGGHGVRRATGTDVGAPVLGALRRRFRRRVDPRLRRGACGGGATPVAAARPGSPRCRVGSSAATSLICTGRTRSWWPAAWSPTTQANWRR